MKGKYLITTDNWFMAPDGYEYRSVWGEARVVEANEALGIKTNRNSTNWYVKIGSEKNHMILAGCQIHYAARCDHEPNIGDKKDYTTSGGNHLEYSRRTKIYIAQ